MWGNDFVVVVACSLDVFRWRERDIRDSSELKLATEIAPADPVELFPSDILLAEQFPIELSPAEQFPTEPRVVSGNGR
jgi:hypothetical protein